MWPMTIKFSRIEENGWKFSHIELSINVIRYIVSNSVAVHHKTMADLLDAVVGVDQSGVVGRGGDERGGGQVYYTQRVLWWEYIDNPHCPKIIWISAYKPSLPWLELMQRSMFGLCARYMRIQKSTICIWIVGSVPAVTGLVFMRRSRFFCVLANCCARDSWVIQKRNTILHI